MVAVGLDVRGIAFEGGDVGIGSERSLVTSSLPSVGTYGEKHLSRVVIHQFNVVQGDDGIGIGDVKEVARI